MPAKAAESDVPACLLHEASYADLFFCIFLMHIMSDQDIISGAYFRSPQIPTGMRKLHYSYGRLHLTTC